MVVVSHLFLFLWKSFRGRFDSCESNLPLFGTIYFPIAPSTKERCLLILCSMALRNKAILSCSFAEGIFIGIAKKVSSLMLTLSCLAPLSPDI